LVAAGVSSVAGKTTRSALDTFTVRSPTSSRTVDEATVSRLRD
jgi:hypothetical protein